MRAKDVERSVLTSAPRLGRSLVAGLLADGVRLALVLGHSLVDILNDVRADRGGEDGGHRVGGLGGLAIGAQDRDGRSGGHFESALFVNRLMSVSSRASAGSKS